MSSVQQDTGTSTALKVTDQLRETTTCDTGVTETLTEEGITSCSEVPTPISQSTCSDNIPTVTSKAAGAVDVSSSDEEKSFGEVGLQIKTTVEVEHDGGGVHSDETDDLGDGTGMIVDDGSPNSSVVEAPCRESSFLDSVAESESEEGSISDPHPADSEEDEGSLQSRPSRPSRNRQPPKRYTYDMLGQPTCRAVQANAQSSWIPEFCRSFLSTDRHVIGTIQHV
ncbi:uncharacterized protein LOC119730838 [Patiria miniata]|uniref:Uncharacterized protein n=1 Tax=Patiria miniata TaxID=46514 RepID=A0A914A7I1_PATMI|nr:uncharacterized protein LOC119730838 [Patiria miniata]